MGFLETVWRVKTYLEGQGRVSLRARKLEFDLDDAGAAAAARSPSETRTSPQASLAVLDDALPLMERAGEGLWRANAMALRGDLLLARGLPADADVWYRAGLELARAQSARMWELRAATRLARLWHGQRKTDEARELLAPICGWFTEGFDTPDLEDAKALLDELG